ncbi:MAG: N-acetylmuramic acid 6-phosphate etherase [Vulcanimicrobiaceae bacterium]
MLRTGSHGSNMQNGLPQTEAINPRTSGLDELSTADLVYVLADEQRAAVDAVVAQSVAIARAVDEISARLRAGGRLHYVGAGTSGRLGILDASEMPPTFGTDPSLVCAHIAGGETAIRTAVEGAEDDAQAGAREMRDHVLASDAVVGISASGGAPFVVGALETARSIGAWTLGIANSPGAPVLQAADLGIVLETGPEPLTGSTRLKAGTSQKVLLNTLSTATMVRLGKVYDNLMVDVVATNKKLRGRARRLVTAITSVDDDRAQALLDAAGGRVKVAAVMARHGVDADAARSMLDRNHGDLRKSL